MRPSRLSFWVAFGSVVVTGLVAAWGLVVDPEPAVRWLLLGAFLPTLWGYVEAAQLRGEDPRVGSAIVRVHRYCIGWVGVMVSSRVAVALAVHSALLDVVWISHGRRLSGLVLGVGLVVFGNILPTLRSPWPLQAEPFAWQRVHRFVGWVFVLAGFGILGAWTFLPVESAGRTAFVIAAIAVALGFGRKVTSLLNHSVDRPLMQ